MGDIGWLADLTLDRVLRMMRSHGVTEILYKFLAPNDNSKNQVYLAGDFSQLGKIPSGEVTAYESKTRKNGGVAAVFRAPLKFSWLNAYGGLTPAPDAKLIYYPQYPEVRFSGFLKGSSDAPSSLFDTSKRGREPGRVLVLGLNDSKSVVAITLDPKSPAAREISNFAGAAEYGALWSASLTESTEYDPLQFLRKLCLIHRMGFVDSMRLDKFGNIVPCESSNCNGNTLEALLGISSNGFAEPDFMGWEIKARTVSNVDRPGSSVITLFTPEPNSGLYRDMGVPDFLRQYGYDDAKVADRKNFGGIHKVGGGFHSKTNMSLRLDGYDSTSPRIFSPSGGVELVTATGAVAMRWDFAKLLEHWKKKHAQAAYVPCVKRSTGPRAYHYGRQVLLGVGADFTRVLHAMSTGAVYYDPGIKLENVSQPNATSKRRSQFRVTSKNIPALYENHKVVDVCDPTEADMIWKRP